MIGTREVKRQNGVVKERDKVVGGRRKQTKGNGQRGKETKLGMWKKRQNNGTEKESDNVMEQRRREMGYG